MERRPNSAASSARLETVVTSRIPVAGLEFLRESKKAEACALNGLRALDEFPSDSDGVLDAIIEWRKIRGGCSLAKQRLLDALKNLQEAIDVIRLAKEFLSSSNFNAIGYWAEHPLCPLALRAGVDAAGRLSMAVPGAKHYFRCEMRPCVTASFPSMPQPVERKPPT